jgi:hypothetical protein
MMKKGVWLILLLFPLGSVAYGDDGNPTSCAPVKNGKICYSADVKMDNRTKESLFDPLKKWASETYGRDIFYSNVSSDKGRASLQVRSKVEILLDETDKTFVKFRIKIQCYDNRYTVDITDLLYQYDLDKDKRHQTYPAEDVILNEGKGNRVDNIKNPLLFCNATRYFADNLIAEILFITGGK